MVELPSMVLSPDDSVAHRGLSRNNSVEPRNTRSTRKENRGRLRAGQSKGDGFVRSSFGVAIDIRRTSLSACVFVCFVCFVVPSTALIRLSNDGDSCNSSLRKRGIRISAFYCLLSAFPISAFKERTPRFK